jgi:hypothetical protein
MTLTESDLAEFAQIIREDYGVELTPEQAKREAESLVHFAYLLSQPQP